MQNNKKEKQLWDYYYDAMECLCEKDNQKSKKLLKKAIELDEDFVAAYMGMTAVFKDEENEEKIKKYTNLAFEKTRKIFHKWPEEMHWGVLENRQYLRAICDKAALYHREGNLKEVERLYCLILKMNPSDNQGIRYLLAGMFEGLMPEDIDILFDEGDALQDWSKLKKMLIKQNKKHKFW